MSYGFGAPVRLAARQRLPGRFPSASRSHPALEQACSFEAAENNKTFYSVLPFRPLLMAKYKPVKTARMATPFIAVSGSRMVMLMATKI